MPRNIVRRRSETVSKQCLRLVFHEKHVFELCFEKEEKESVQKEEFWSQQVSIGALSRQAQYSDHD